jgi:iron complex transport system permease protein
MITVSAVLIPPMLGAERISLISALAEPASLSGHILFELRLPRIFFALLTGGTLALIGAAFQALLRNDLATPYTLGVSSGGALGAVIAIKSGLIFQFLGFSTIAVFSILGSIGTIFIILFIASRRGGYSGYGLVLGGVAVSFSFSALTLFVQFLADFTETYRMVRWLMGSMDVFSWKYPVILMVMTLVIFLYFYRHARAFNILLAGTDFARSKGVAVGSIRKTSFLMGSVIVGYIVSVCGPIGFIGLVIPHIIRIISGPDHRKLFIYSLVLGGAFLVWCDTIARIIILPAELPVGIVTSLIGGPFFIFLLLRKK